MYTGLVFTVEHDLSGTSADNTVIGGTRGGGRRFIFVALFETFRVNLDHVERTHSQLETADTVDSTGSVN